MKKLMVFILLVGVLSSTNPVFAAREASIRDVTFIANGNTLWLANTPNGNFTMNCGWNMPSHIVGIIAYKGYGYVASRHQVDIFDAAEAKNCGLFWENPLVFDGIIRSLTREEGSLFVRMADGALFVFSLKNQKKPRLVSSMR